MIARMESVTVTRGEMGLVRMNWSLHSANGMTNTSRNEAKLKPPIISYFRKTNVLNPI
jgi:hypothetical protein